MGFKGVLIMKWISVKDELPSNGDQVRTKDNTKREFDCTFYFHENRGNRPYFHVNGFVWEHDKVTHWMPVPCSKLALNP